MKKLLLLLPLLFSLTAEAQVKADSITTNNPSKVTVDFLKTIDIQTTNGMYLPSGTTGQRPSPTKDGMIRYNSTIGQVEKYSAGNWSSIGGSGGGISDWVTAKAYVIGDVVIQAQKIYQCLIAHTSGTFATDLANGDWQEISASPNLTGAVTSVGAATSLGSFTSANLATALTNETGTGVAVFATSPTLVTPVLGAATGASLSTSGNITSTGGNISATVGVISGLGFSSSGVITASGNITSSTGNITSTTGSLNSVSLAVSGAGVVGGSTPNANAVLDVQSTTKAFMPPRMTSAQKVAIASPAAGMVVFDTTIGAVSYYSGSGWVTNASITGDTVYSSRFTTAGVQSSNNTPFVASMSAMSGGQTTGTFIGGTFTVAPNCWCNNDDLNVRACNAVATSATTVVIDAFNNGSLSNSGFTLFCQKRGVDYSAAAPASALIASNADFGWTSYTPAVTGQTNLGGTLRYMRRGNLLTVQGRLTWTGNGNAVAPTIPLPLSLVSDSSSASYSGQVNKASDVGSANYLLVVQNNLTSVTLNRAQVTSTSTQVDGTFPFSPVSGDFIDVDFTLPISTWTVSPYAIVPLAGATVVPSYAGQVDTFSFSFGTTNATTVCSANPCSYLDQIGNAVSSVARSGAGIYAPAFSKTYTKLKCAGNTHANGTTTTVPTVGLRCENCNSLSFTTLRTDLATAIDSTGTIVCQGTF